MLIGTYEGEKGNLFPNEADFLSYFPPKKKKKGLYQC